MNYHFYLKKNNKNNKISKKKMNFINLNLI